MEKVKANIKAFFVGLGSILGLIAAIVFYRKSKEQKALEAKLAMANTQKEVDIIESQINQHKEVIAEDKKQLEKLQTVEADLKAKRENIGEDEKGKSVEEIENYWKKN